MVTGHLELLFSFTGVLGPTQFEADPFALIRSKELPDSGSGARPGRKDFEGKPIEFRDGWVVNRFELDNVVEVCPPLPTSMEQPEIDRVFDFLTFLFFRMPTANDLLLDTLAEDEFA